MARVFVAMSGGVDSSVAAALLLEQGHDVTGVTMQLWPSGDVEGGCCSVAAVRDAKRVCDLLGIAHYTLNFRDAFESQVVSEFAREYAAGRTPNPCIVCNDRLKFSDLLARVSRCRAPTTSRPVTTRGSCAMTPATRGSRAASTRPRTSPTSSTASHPTQLEHVLFPVGELEKPVVRAIAERMGLHVAEKPDSQEVCFASAGQHATVVGERLPGGARAGRHRRRSPGVVLGTAHGYRRLHGRPAQGARHRVAGAALRPGGGRRAQPSSSWAADEDLAVTHVEAGDVVWRGDARGSRRRGDGALPHATAVCAGRLGRRPTWRRRSTSRSSAWRRVRLSYAIRATGSSAEGRSACAS